MGCDEVACMTEIAGALDVDLILSGTLFRTQSAWELSLKLLSPRDSRLVGAEILTLSARDFSVELAAVVSDEAGLTQFAGLPVLQDVPGTEEIDAVIICDITEPQASYDRAKAEFPAERILAPKFLGISKPGKGGGQ